MYRSKFKTTTRREAVVRPSPTDWLSIHKGVLQARTPTLAPVLKCKWNRSQTKKHPGTGSAVEVYPIALNLINNTFLLEGRVSQSGFQTLSP